MGGVRDELCADNEGVHTHTPNVESQAPSSRTRFLYVQIEIIDMVGTRLWACDDALKLDASEHLKHARGLLVVLLPPGIERPAARRRSGGAPSGR